MSEGRTDHLEAAIDGKYRIERELGEGGMATVYKKRTYMMRVRCSSGLSLPAALLVAGLCVAGGRFGVAGQEAPLADAVQRGDGAAILSLLRQQVDVNAAQGDGATALHWAVYLDDAEATASLIRAGANVNAPNDYGVTPLALASTNGNAAIIEQLVRSGADPQDPLHAVNSGETPLMLAARSGQVDAVMVLLNLGADVNATEAWNGQSALMWAAAEGHVPVLQTLIDHGADVRARSNSGATPLLFAARKGSMDAVRRLLAAGSDVNEKRPDGATPLLVAVINGHEDLVDLLLDEGADPNVEGGSTLLTVQGVRAQPMPLEFRVLGYSERESEYGARGNIFGRPLQATVHVANWHLSDQVIGVNLDRLRVIESLLAHGADVNGRNTMEEQLQLFQVVREGLHVIGVQPREVLHPVGIVAVVRHRVVRPGQSNLGVRTIDGFSRHHERSDARDIGLEGEHLQVEHQLGVFLEGLGHADWTIWDLEIDVGRLRRRDALFHVANRTEILAELGAVLPA